MPDSPQTFAALWKRQLARDPSATFLAFCDDEGRVTRWSYAEFDVAVGRVRALLRQHGVRSGDGVHLALRNCPMFVALWLACTLERVWIAPVDPASARDELAQQVRRLHPSLGFCGGSNEDAYVAAARSEGLDCVVVEESASDLGRLPDSAVFDDAAVRGSDRLAVMFTSGTTSQPKGVVLTQRNYFEVAEQMSSVVDLQPEHRWYVTLPLFHANGQYYCFAAAIAVGASVALTARFSASRWVQGAHDLHVTHASLFAAPIRMILARTPSGAPRLHLKHVWFAQSLGSVHYREFAALVGTWPRQLYGMTETIAIVTRDDGRKPRPDVIGRAIPGRRIRLVDQETGADAAPMSAGVIRVAGTPGVSLFSHYLDDPDTTKRTLLEEDGATWLHTGDLAIDLGDGTLRFVGRVDDVIKVAGENVSLTQLEATIAQAPGVLEAAALAKPDPILDLVPVAYVVARDAADPPDVVSLSAWAVANLAPASRPREWHLVESLPRTSVGKVRRFALNSPGSVPERGAHDEQT